MTVTKTSDSDPTERLERAKAEQELAEVQLAAAQARRQEAEAKHATDVAQRALTTAEVQARRDAAKAEAESRKAVAEADAAAVKAFLPGPATLKPLEGTVSADDKSGILVETVAYSLLDAAAGNMVEKFVQAGLDEKARILVLSSQDLVASDWQYAAVLNQIEQLITALDTLNTTIDAEIGAEPASDGQPQRDDDPPPGGDGEGRSGLPLVPVGAVLSALPQLVGAGADVAGYFQSNYTITGRVVEAKTEPVVAAIAGHLKAKAKVVVDGFHVLRPDGEVLTSYDKLVAVRWKLARRRIALQKLIEDAARNGESPLAYRDDIVELTKAAEEKVDAFCSTALSAPAAGGLPPLGQAALREELRAKKDPKITHVLHVAVSSIGGEVRIRQRRFRAPQLTYVGSCTFSVLLSSTAGDLVYAGTESMLGQLSFKINDKQIGPVRAIKIDGDPSSGVDQKPKIHSSEADGDGETKSAGGANPQSANPQSAAESSVQQEAVRTPETTRERRIARWAFWRRLRWRAWPSGRGGARRTIEARGIPSSL